MSLEMVKINIYPYFNQLDEMIRFQPNSRWFDNKTTNEKESLLDICKKSFSSTVKSFSTIDSIAQQWQFFQGTDISHVQRFLDLDEWIYLHLAGKIL